MKVVVLQRNANQSELDDKSRQHLSFMRELSSRISQYHNIKLIVEDEFTFKFNEAMSADNTIVIVAGSQGNQKAKELKETNNDIRIIGLMNCLNQSLVDDLHVDLMVLPTSFCSEQKEQEEHLVNELEASRVHLLRIEQDQSNFPSSHGISEIASVLAEEFQWQSIAKQSIEEDAADKDSLVDKSIHSTVSRWGTTASDAMKETYRNYPVTTKIIGGLSLFGVLAYAGSKTEVGKDTMKSVSKSMGLGAGSSN